MMHAYFFSLGMIIELTYGDMEDAPGILATLANEDNQ